MGLLKYNKYGVDQSRGVGSVAPKISYIGRGQVQGHKPLKVGNSTIFKGYFLPHL